jgi:hypothetical protein
MLLRVAFRTKPKALLQVVIDFFKYHLIAIEILVQVPGSMVLSGLTYGEGFPKRRLPLARNMDQRLAPGYLGRFCDLVVRIVGKEGKVGILPTSGQPPVAGDKHPVVGVTNDTHEKRPQFIAVRYLEKAFFSQ